MRSLQEHPDAILDQLWSPFPLLWSHPVSQNHCILIISSLEHRCHADHDEEYDEEYNDDDDHDESDDDGGDDVHDGVCS